jgi:hypothetical protein
VATIDAELSNLTAALAADSELASVIAAIKEREARRDSLTRELDGLDGAGDRTARHSGHRAGDRRGRDGLATDDP